MSTRVHPERFQTDRHPCYSIGGSHKFARIHLPVAPRCNIQCNYCNRKFDCVNESRPGVTSKVLSPVQALAYLGEMKEKIPTIEVMGIAGPGDPFANPYETMETLRLVRRRFPEMMLCLASNGLHIGPYIDEIAELDVTHVTITINAVDPKIGALVYRWVRDGDHPLKGEEGAQLMIDRQLEAVAKLAERGVAVKVNSIVIPGVNDHHIPRVAKVTKDLGAALMNCIPLCPVEDTPFENLTEPDGIMMARVRLQSGENLSQMSHCARCRADAVGLLNEDRSLEFAETLQSYTEKDMPMDKSRPFVAVATQEGMLVNLHLGEADKVIIYGHHEESDEYEIIDVRRLPPHGGGDDRWKELAHELRDCRAILVSACGPRPKSIIEGFGLAVIEMEGLIEEGLEAIYEDEEIPTSLRRRFTSCGDGCSGTGTGCG
ncbi:nitrogenase cofactor biosynthesis protein NifB [Haloferula sargassicola]|uniref:FeMo cofactor biosynthesis protein NifB n=1 Tax=Haloferula sargassicola TaxID=490096 RepID=A0ABP9UJL7_9BACT